MKITTNSDRAYKVKRAEQSRMCRARKKAAAAGMTVEEYLESTKPMTYEEVKARRNEQSKASRQRKKTRETAELARLEEIRIKRLAGLVKANEALKRKREEQKKEQAQPVLA